MTGGLGFRDVKVINMALLAKGLLEYGIRWRVGNRTKIAVYKDRWIPKTSTLKVFSPPNLCENATVQQLILPSGSWDVRLVTDNFTEEDREAILSLHMGISRVEDTVMWHYDQCGSYSVKSGYWLGSAMVDLPRTSGLSGTDSWWKYLWRLSMALKIKMFIWIACYDWVPTRCNLGGRGMKITTDCPMCKQSLETTLHTVWGCRIFKDVCKSCNFGVHMGKGGATNWVPPNSGLFKLNTDAALNASGGVVGVGSVVRDSMGCVLATSSQQVVATYNAQLAEAVAIHRDLVLACKTGLYPVEVESNAKVVVGWINDSNHYSSEFRAKLALSCEEDYVWLEDFPPCIRRHLLEDAPGCV
ncbi:hypothetical protein Dsin_004633 [Dipteronia sinensis]|uniref:RNase H type-1 domain-containing protein n=1 Tax=Dipteronia sinensis TaxID=43782 RepID=A0AAE0AUY4_9ROSI|nr:hypothetical protein Dsin_004633 [Dipteronia sinensis]